MTVYQLLMKTALELYVVMAKSAGMSDKKIEETLPTVAKDMKARLVEFHRKVFESRETSLASLINEMSTDIPEGCPCAQKSDADL